MSRQGRGVDRLIGALHPTKMLGEDGIIRGHKEELELNLLFAQVFKGEAGDKLLDYLRSITVHQVNGPRVSDGELRHLEGQRFLTALIERRTENGRRRYPELPEQQRDGDASEPS